VVRKFGVKWVMGQGDRATIEALKSQLVEDFPHDCGNSLSSPYSFPAFIECKVVQIFGLVF